MRLLLDQGLAPLAAATLRHHGFDALHVAELALDRADDREILDYARRGNLICVTLDHDFHAHLAMAGDGSPSVIFLRIEGLKAQQQADLIRSICAQCGEALSAGAAVSADLQTIRIRRLPLE
ncbi:MAG TPA: DUF5615 family PIN-like protein [Bryobacteraceae bacterium]|nr:DUF5615 family PIN-like protein [Bryobacteraceae bacterium]